MKGQRLVFRRVAGYPVPPAVERAVAGVAEASPGRHPLWGALRGAITLARGTDLTGPADRDWGDDTK